MDRLIRQAPAVIAAAVMILVLSTCSNPVDFREAVIDQVKVAKDLYLEITEVTPIDKTSDVSTFQTLLIEFDREIDLETVTASTITVFNDDDQEPVTWMLENSGVSDLVKLKPTSMEGPKWHTVTVTGVKGKDGSSLRDTYAWTFKTKLGPGGSVFINNNSDYTNSTAVTCNIEVNGNVASYRVTVEDPPTTYWTTNPNADWQPFPGPGSTTYALPDPLPGGDGVKKVYIQFRNALDERTPLDATALYDSIILDMTPPSAPVVSGTTPTSSRTPTWSWTSGGGGIGKFKYNFNASGWSGETAATSYTPASDLLLGDYATEVQERDAAGNWSTSGSKTIEIGPAAPTNVSATDNTSTTQVTVTWTGSADATSYDVQRSTTTAFTSYSTFSGVTTPYYDTTASPGILYYYRVVAWGAGNASTPSSYNSGFRKLATPTGVTASDNTITTHIAVSWGAVTGAEVYYICRATTSGGTYTDVDKVAAPTVSYNDTGVTAGIAYYYKIRAATAGYDSDLSTYNAGVRQLSAPASITATDGTDATGVAVSWGAVTSAVSYTVYRATTSGGAYSSVTSGVAALTWTDTTVGDSVNFYYKVAAVSAYTGAQSAYDAGYKGLPAPTGVSATDGTHDLSSRVSWDVVTGATGYAVYASSTAAGTYSLLGTTAVLYYDDATKDHTVLYYKVRAYSNASFPGVWSAYNSGWWWDMTVDLTGWWHFDNDWYDDGTANGIKDDFKNLIGPPMFDKGFIGPYSVSFVPKQLAATLTKTFMSEDRRYMSVAFWVYPGKAHTTNTPIMACSDFIVSQSSSDRINFTVTTSKTVTAYYTVPIKDWTHIVGVYDYAKSVLSLYVNGKLAYDTALGGTVANGDIVLKVGGSDKDNLWWTGMVDELRIYNRVLTKDEIAGLYRWR